MNPFVLRRIRGPVYLLCFALTAILAQWGVLSYSRSWPLYIVTAGLLDLLEAVFPLAPTQAFAVGLPRRRSLAGAFLLLLIGFVALLTTTDVLPFANFWHVYATWWPLLLILLGVLLLLERVFDRNLSRRYAGAYAGQYVPRRRGSGGLVLLVLLLVGVGLISPGSPYLSNDAWRWNPDWNWSFSGEAHENEVSFSAPLAADALLTVDNGHGDLEIAPSTDGLIHVEAHQTAHVRDREKDRAFRDTRPVFAVHGTNATLTVPEKSGVDVRLVLAVPEGVACTVHNHHGDVAMSGLRRAVELTEDHGDVTLDGLGGNVHLVMDHGDVTARALGADLTIDGRTDDISASGVKGRVVLHGDFFGDTQLDNVGSTVDFHSSRTELTAQRMAGQLTLDSDDLRISGVSGGLKIATRSKDIDVTDLSGDAEIEDSNDDITVAARQPLGALTLTDNTGNLTLTVPENAGFSLHGQTGDGDEIESDLALSQSTTGSLKTVSGQVGQGGPHLELRTSHGDLTIHRSHGDTALPPMPPTPPLPPAPPSRVRHLHSPAAPPEPTVQ